MKIKIIKHAPKDNSISHITGMESQLSDIAKQAVSEYIKSNDFEGYKILIHTSPVQRAKDTATYVYEGLKEDVNVSLPIVMKGFGSYEEIEGTVKNLISPEMSKMWGEAKEKGKDINGAENDSLYEWCKVGYFEKHNNTGISLNEMCERMYRYIINLKGDKNTLHLIISHSGDIEPFVYWLITKNRNIELKSNPMPNLFNETEGALKPLEGIDIEVLSREMYVEYRDIKFVLRV